MAPLLDDLKANASAPKCVVGNMHKKGTRQSITGKHRAEPANIHIDPLTHCCVCTRTIFLIFHIF